MYLAHNLPCETAANLLLGVRQLKPITPQKKLLVFHEFKIKNNQKQTAKFKPMQFTGNNVIFHASLMWLQIIFQLIKYPFLGQKTFLTIVCC